MAEQEETRQERQQVQQPAQPEAPTPQKQQQSQGRPCPKDCRRCTMYQQICCASMLSFQSFEVMDAIIKRLDDGARRMEALEEKLSRMNAPEGELTSPLPFQGAPSGK